MADVTVIGNVGGDPELRFTPSGTAVCTFSLADTRVWEKDGEKQEATTWYRCQVWKDAAENVADSVQKGDRVMVHGRLDNRGYETPEGEKRFSLEINVWECGPSLRWAKAKVEKNPRSSGGGGGNRYDAPLPEDAPF